MKKLVIISIFLLLLNCKGYKPVFSPSDIDFQIEDISLNNNDKISKSLEKRLAYFLDTQSEKKIRIKLDSFKDEKILAKNKKGNPDIFEIVITTNLGIEINNETNKNFTFKERFSFNDQSNKFELNQYKKINEKILIDRIFQKILTRLRLL